MKRVGQVYREKLVNRIEDALENNKSVFLLNYSQLSGAKMNDLRKNLKSAGADVYVSRNAIARLALKNLKQESLADRVNGQTAFIWTRSDAVAIAKILVKFVEGCESATVPGGLVEGQILEQHDVKKFSKLPSREILLAMLLGTIQSPVSRLAGVLNAKSRELLSILKQLSEKTGGNKNG